MSRSLAVAAATVILLRDGAAGVEVLMTQRRADASFAAGALVFPGGKVDPGDGDVAEQALRAAAVREAFEECAIRLDPGSLVPFAHWITPANRPRRFDTWFFVAPAPPGQVAKASPDEVTQLIWATPAFLVAESVAGRT